MSGLNSLGGLNNVNVDFRPTVELTAPKKDGTAPQQPVANVVPENAPPAKAEAKSVVRQLPVVLQARLPTQDVQMKQATNHSWRKHGKRERDGN